MRDVLLRGLDKAFRKKNKKKRDFEKILYGFAFDLI